jgi:CheY-like chemotaxis protein
MDGLALIRAIRAAGSPQVKIAAMSADDTAEKRITAIDGANAYLLKGPSLKRQLLELLASDS